MSEHKEHEFTIYVNNNEFHTDQRELTGAQIKELAHVPADYELYEVKGDKTERVADTEVVHIHNDMHFRAIPPGTFGSLWPSHQD